MFAFALWDTIDRELFCARDPFGIKPLFMRPGPVGQRSAARRSACWIWLPASASTSGSTIAPCSTTRAAVRAEPETLHRGIRRLESGSYARVRPGEPPEVTR